MSWGCSQVRAAPAPPLMGPGPCPVAHAHSPAASAIGSGQLCPPGDNHLLLLLLLQSPPQPRAGPGAVPAALSPALCPQSAALRSQHPSGFAMEPAWGQPSPSVSLAATSPSLWAWAGTGMWEVRREEATGPQGRLLAQLEEAGLLPAIISPASNAGVLLYPILGAVEGALLAFPCTITGFLASLAQPAGGCSPGLASVMGAWLGPSPPAPWALNVPSAGGLLPSPPIPQG